MGTPAVTRELSIAYGDVTVGGTSDVYLLDHSFPRTVRGDYERIEVTCTIQVVGSTESAFVTNCKALENEFMEPNQDLTITLGSSSWAYSHASNTGYLARPSWEVIPDPSNSARSRLYQVSVVVNRPADLTGKSGLRAAQVTVTTDLSGRRTLEVSGTYTALSGNNATAQFTAAYGTYLGTLETALTGTWERGDVRYSTDDTDKVLTFRATSREPGYNQSTGGLDHAAIKGQSFSVARTEIAPGDVAGTVRLRTLAIAYEATIVRAQTTGLQSFYEATIKPHLLARARTIAGSSAIALVRAEPRYDLENNRITVAMELQAAGTSSTLVYTMVTEDTDRAPIALVPVWTGDPYARAQFPAPGVRTRTVTQNKIVLGGAGGSGGAAGGNGSVLAGTPFGVGATGGVTVTGGDGMLGGLFGAGATGGMILSNTGSGGGDAFGAFGAGDAGDGGSWVRTGGSYRRKPYRVGTSDAFIDVTEITQTDTYEYATTPSGGEIGYESGGGAIPSGVTSGPGPPGIVGPGPEWG